MIYLSEDRMLRSTHVSGLAATVEDELTRQGKNWAWLAKETEFAPSTFTAWKTEPERIPELDKLAKVAEKLGVSLRILIEACGFPVDATPGYADRQARAAAMVAAIPRLVEVVEDIARLRPDDQRWVLSFIETWIRDRGRRQSRKE